MYFLQTVTEPVAASGLFSLAWLMIAIPLVIAGLLLVGGRATNGWGHYLATLAPIASFVIGLLLFVDLLGRDGAQRAVEVPVYQWLSTGEWTFQVSLLVDQLSILFVLLITGVGSLIHVYSLGYMAHDENRRRFFAYLNLFIAAMLILVLADNYLLLFVGWEGVGLASYLLIGFWQHRDSAAKAAKKAFVVNRVGDLGMVMGIAVMLSQIGSVTFTDVAAGIGQVDKTWVILLGFLLLLAACGKSAQVPLQSWLLDAMEGPTPVSALIHAATMVTAGVYLVVRSHPIYTLAPEAALAVAIVGTVTLLFGAWIGTSKDDIKKVLAGSTMSQIGYMMLAAGIGPAGAAFAIFHLITHGFFKANMFLGAGSVMHGMNDDVDMRRFGGLAKYMPITFVTFGLGYLAIIGFPLTSGFYSKDHIIEAAWDKHLAFGLLALLGAGVTAYYMTRLMMMTFFGAKRWKDDVHPHESPLSMTVPLIVLAVLSVGAGIVMNGWIGNWLAPAVGDDHPHTTGLLHITPVGWATMATVAVGVLIGWALHRRSIPQTQPETRNPLVLAGRRDLFGDDVNLYAFQRPGEKVVSGLATFDDGIVDGAVRGGAGVFTGMSMALRRLQNGYVRSYALTIIVGVLLLAAAMYLGHLA